MKRIMKKIEQGDTLVVSDLRNKVKAGKNFTLDVKGKDISIEVMHVLSERQKDIMLQGGIINWVKNQKK